jgi:hypothetical protein
LMDTVGQKNKTRSQMFFVNLPQVLFPKLEMHGILWALANSTPYRAQVEASLEIWC